MKHVQTCLSARKDGDLSFHNFGGPVKLMQTYLYAENTLQTPFSPPRRSIRRPVFVPEKM